MPFSMVMACESARSFILGRQLDVFAKIVFSKSLSCLSIALIVFHHASMNGFWGPLW